MPTTNTTTRTQRTMQRTRAQRETAWEARRNARIMEWALEAESEDSAAGQFQPIM